MVKYCEEESLGPAIATLNGRWFGGRQIVAEEWDGREKFKIEETEEVTPDELNFIFISFVYLSFHRLQQIYDYNSVVFLVNFILFSEKI